MRSAEILRFRDDLDGAMGMIHDAFHGSPDVERPEPTPPGLPC